MELAIAEPFVAPVDLNVYPTYAYIVEYPIDLSTIKVYFCKNCLTDFMFLYIKFDFYCRLVLKIISTEESLRHNSMCVTLPLMQKNSIYHTLRL